MAKKKQELEITKNEGLNVTWFVSASILVCIVFLGIRYLIKGEPYVPYVPMHLRGKVKVEVYKPQQKQRDVKGYNLSY